MAVFTSVMYCDRHVDSPWTEFHPQSLVKVWPGQRTVSTGMQSLKKDQREHLLDTDILTVRECHILKSSHLQMLYSIFVCLLSLNGDARAVYHNVSIGASVLVIFCGHFGQMLYMIQI